MVWQALGDVPNFVEPFAGSLAVLLNRPHPPGIETVNDLDAFLVNVFRALQADASAVAGWCDFPVNEAQLHAVHTWLVGQRETFTARLMGDPDYYDVTIAGRWLYGICCWIGGGWCSGKGPWQSVEGDEGYRQIVHVGSNGRGVHRQLVHLGDTGMGVHRQLVPLGTKGMGVHRQLPHLGDTGRGVKRSNVHLGSRSAGQGVHKSSLDFQTLRDWFAALETRLRRVRVCCGDWTRVLGPSVTYGHGMTGVLLDPPYALEEDRDMSLYREDSGTVAHDVRAWCLANGDNPFLRIVLCGYAGTHDALLAKGWRVVHWRAGGGYGNQGRGRGRANAQRETLWLSPACLTSAHPVQLPLLG